MSQGVGYRVALAVKRGLDVLLSAVGLTMILPLLLAVALAVRWSLGSPVLFRQRRPGRGDRLFELWKFRTMTDETDASGRLLPDDARITRLGRTLRRMSLDELPTLWNVLKGEMSLVGPRPLLPEYLDRYTANQARRHEVLPGITGWAQVNGRNAISWDEKLALDVWYVDHWSLILDAKILLKTFAIVIGGRGISHGDAATMPEFKGTDPVERPR